MPGKPQDIDCGKAAHEAHERSLDRGRKPKFSHEVNVKPGRGEACAARYDQVGNRAPLGCNIQCRDRLTRAGFVWPLTLVDDLMVVSRLQTGDLPLHCAQETLEPILARWREAHPAPPPQPPPICGGP